MGGNLQACTTSVLASPATGCPGISSRQGQRACMLGPSSGLTFHETPEMPSLLLPTAPIVPATWVPCPSRSATSKYAGVPGWGGGIFG